MNKNRVDSDHTENNEDERLQELFRYNILDTPNEPSFDHITKLAAYLCGVENARIHFLDQDRQWVKSFYGKKGSEKPRSDSVCNITIQNERRLVVSNLKKDPRFNSLKEVKHESVCFYAGVVLKSSKGAHIGTLCVFSKDPKTLSEEQIEALEILAREVETHLELRVKQKKLEEQNREMKTSSYFLANSADIRCILSPDTLNIQDVNDEALELLGYSRDEMVDSPISIFIQQDEFTGRLQTWAAGSGPSTFSAETIFRTKDHRLLWILVTVSEKNNSFYFTGKNVSARKETEKKYLRQTRFTEDIIQNLPGIFLLMDKSGLIKKWNQTLVHLTGHSPAEIENTSFKEIIDPAERRKADAAIHDTIQKGYARTTLNVISAQSDPTPTLFIGFRHQDHQKTYAVGIGIDVSKEKKARDQLERKELELEKAQRIGKMGSWTWNIQDNRLHWSDEVYDLLGLDPETYQPTIEKFRNMLPHDDRKKVLALVKQIKNGGQWQDIELKVNKPDGSDIFIREKGEITFNEQNNPVKVSGTIQDITEQKENEKKLKNAIKEKDLLLSEVHHRVKNNLAIIHGLLQLEMFNTDDEQLKNILYQSQMRIHSMALIHETLYSSGDFANIKFGAYIDELITLLIDTYGNETKEISVNLEADDVKLNINQAIPCALMVNELLTNSLKHAFPEQDTGTITVKIIEEKQNVTVNVSDNGIGFEKIPDPETSNTLGLTLINKLNAQLNGNLTIANDDGASFEVTFRKKDGRGSSANYIPD